jgi:hypothetical protein
MSITVTPAADRTLATVSEVKAALGITGSTEDTALTSLIARVSDMIARACNVAEAPGAIPTLRSEVVVETFRLSDRCEIPLILARRFVTAIGGVVEDGTELDADETEFDGPAGMLYRLCDDYRIHWPRCVKVVATYTAGFATVPEDLKLACISAVQERRSGAGANPLLKREDVPGLGEQEFWVGGLAKIGQGPFSAQVMEMLSPYRTLALA